MNSNARRGFMAELSVMLVAFIMVIVIITSVFARAKAMSDEAKHLSDATILASNTAEVFLTCDDEEEIYQILNENGNTVKGEKIISSYNEMLKADKSGKMKVEIAPEKSGNFIKARITVYYLDQMIYELDTGHMIGGGQ